MKFISLMKEGVIKMEKVKLTELEEEMLRAIPEECFYQEGFESVLWTNCFLDGLKMDNKVARGVLSSLKQKGVLNVQGTGREGVIWLNEVSIEWLKENVKTIDEKGYVIHHTKTLKNFIKDEIEKKLQ